MKKKVKVKKKADPYADWKCQKCGSYETRKRYGRRYADQEIGSGSMPKVDGEYYELHCNDCGHIETITEEKYNKMYLKNYKQK